MKREYRGMKEQNERKKKIEEREGGKKQINKVMKEEKEVAIKR